MNLEQYVRNIPDFPKKGIHYKDITTLLKEGQVFAYIINQLTEYSKKYKPDKIVGIESRGFIFGTPLAYNLGCGFIPVRKPGKLPYKTISENYELEYGTNSLEIHVDGIKAGERTIIIDDLLATGGTAKATINLIERLGGSVEALNFIIELEFLEGREKLSNYNIFSFIKFN